MELAWDPKKAAENLEVHGVRFADTEPVFYDARAITVEDVSAIGEQRFATLGIDGLGRLLVVVYAYRGEAIRVISARKATAREALEYEKEP